MQNKIEICTGNDGLGTNLSWVIAVHIAVTRINLSAARKHPPCWIWELHHQWQGHTRPHPHFFWRLYHPHISSWCPHSHWLILMYHLNLHSYPGLGEDVALISVTLFLVVCINWGCKLSSFCFWFLLLFSFSLLGKVLVQDSHQGVLDNGGWVWLGNVKDFSCTMWSLDNVYPEFVNCLQKSKWEICLRKRLNWHSSTIVGNFFIFHMHVITSKLSKLHVLARYGWHYNSEIKLSHFFMVLEPLI